MLIQSRAEDRLREFQSAVRVSGYEACRDKSKFTQLLQDMAHAFRSPVEKAITYENALRAQDAETILNDLQKDRLNRALDFGAGQAPVKLPGD